MQPSTQAPEAEVQSGNAQSGNEPAGSSHGSGGKTVKRAALRQRMQDVAAARADGKGAGSSKGAGGGRNAGGRSTGGKPVAAGGSRTGENVKTESVESNDVVTQGRGERAPKAKSAGVQGGKAASAKPAAAKATPEKVAEKSIGSKAASAKAAPAKAAPAKAAPAKAAPAKAAAPKASAPKASAPKASAPKASAAKSASRKSDGKSGTAVKGASADKAQPAKSGASKAGASKAGGSKAGAVRAGRAANDSSVSEIRPVAKGTVVAARATARRTEDLAKVASARSDAAARKAAKPANDSEQDTDFEPDDYIVYPTHGVGRILAIEAQEISGHHLRLMVIEFEKDKMTLRVPLAKVDSVGIRKLSSPQKMKTAMETLKGRARVKRTMWSRRAQEYEAKINSGDPVSIAEVVRDLHRNAGQPDQSYSERQIYEAALDRLARELAAIERIDEEQATKRLEEVLAA
jgi:CarD family transcriptional regulator